MYILMTMENEIYLWNNRPPIQVQILWQLNQEMFIILILLILAKQKKNMHCYFCLIYEHSSKEHYVHSQDHRTAVWKSLCEVV